MNECKGAIDMKQDDKRLAVLYAAKQKAWEAWDAQRAVCQTEDRKRDELHTTFRDACGAIQVHRAIKFLDSLVIT